MVYSGGGGGGQITNDGVSQVSLVHSSDSVRTVVNNRPSSVTRSPYSTKMPSTSTSPFVSAAPMIQRMPKPPVRVVAHHPPPHQNIPHHQQAPAHHQMIQQQQMYARPHVIPTMSVQPMAGRATIDMGQNQQPQQIKRPGQPGFQGSENVDFGGVKPQSVDMIQRVRAVRRQVADEESELRRLRELEHETNVLRSKNTGREQELTVVGKRLNEEQSTLRNATMRVKSLTRNLEEMYKRRQTAAAAALVEQRKMQQQQSLASRPASTEVVRPRASVEPFQVVTSVPKVGNDDQMKKEGFTDGYNTTDGIDKIPNEPAYLAPSSPKKEKREEPSPSPPKDPHPSQQSPKQKNTTSNVPYLSTFAAAPAVSTFEQKINSSTMTRDSPSSVVERPTSFGDSLDESRLRSGKTDLVSLRSDSLKATKRRSWAASEGTSMSEAEVIHRLLDEQRRGRNHFIPQLPTPQEEEPSMPIETLSATEEISSTNAIESSVERGIEHMSLGSDTTTEEETSSCSARSDDEQNLEMEVPQEKRVVKGILRKPNEKMHKGRIEFDPLALLLDAALEGEYDLVVSSASKLADVSQANDEGITALHNAICAGHYEIVKFLIENDADVNAQDSDGWTPLHCAASCNNLPMVRQLVEGGGCVLASTLSDMETPVEKCEEEEDGYDGCLKYLMAAHSSTGSINGGKVYAAYPYEAEYEDELSFNAGDELLVLSKDDVDKSWWTCQNSSGEKGLVPRTYLALYPALKYRKRLNFVMFDLPMEFNNNAE